MKAQTDDGRVLIQEYIHGDPATYGYALLVLGGQVVLSFGHKEIRSVPRLGGSATRIRTFESEELRETSERLLRALKYEGVALVEYKRRTDGSFALMEVNPKFWASYSLASKCNFHFAAQLVSSQLGLPIRRYDRRTNVEMVFPLREMRYCVKHWGRQGELITKSIATLLCPPVQWDLSIKELWWCRPF